MRKKRQPRLAGILMLIAAVLPLMWLGMALSRTSVAERIIRNHVTWYVMPLPYFGLAVGFGGNATLSNVLAAIFLLGILLSIIGGVFSLRRKAWAMAFAGSIGALVCVPVLGIAAVVLTVLSRDQFGHQNEA